MTDQTRPGAVLYVKDVKRVVAFYAGVVGLAVHHMADDHVVLESPIFQLVVIRIPRDIAAAIEIQDPPVRRERTPIKIAFNVERIADARAAAARLGGGLNASASQWRFGSSNVCDGYDPEGNIFQVRERAE